VAQERFGSAWIASHWDYFGVLERYEAVRHEEQPRHLCLNISEVGAVHDAYRALAVGAPIGSRYDTFGTKFVEHSVLLGSVGLEPVGLVHRGGDKEVHAKAPCMLWF